MRSWLTLTNILVGFIALVVVSLVGTSAYDNRPFNPAHTVQVYADPGGSIFEFQSKYAEIEQKGEYLQFNGPCVSACTFFSKLVNPERVCATVNATFWFHGVYDGAGNFIPTFTQWAMPLVFTDKVINLLKEKGFDGTKDVDREKYPAGIIQLTRDELGIKHCEG